MASLLTNLKQLSNACGVSGDESAVRKIVIGLIKDHVDELRVDTMGNVLAVKRAQGKPKLRILLDAHMDEIGFMIFGPNSDGTLKFRAVGGIDDRILPGKAVLIGPDRIPGVIGLKPIHLAKGDKTVAAIEDLAIDIGAANDGHLRHRIPHVERRRQWRCQRQGVGRSGGLRGVDRDSTRATFADRDSGRLHRARRSGTARRTGRRSYIRS